MRTRKPSFESSKSLLSLLDIHIGSILRARNNSFSKERQYIVVGSSQNEYALIAVYEENEINGLSAFFIPIHLTSEDILYYADYSKLIIRRFGTISAYIKKHPDCLLSKVDNNELTIIIDHIKNSRTISKHIKAEYLL